MADTSGGRFAIIGGGEVQDYTRAKPLVEGAFVISADSGLRHCERMGIRPDLLVGDFDSWQGSLPENIPQVEFSPVEKDYTDSTFALEEALRRHPCEVVFVGMLGGRLDHTLANLQNLARCAARGLPCRLSDGVTDVWAVQGPAVFQVPCAGDHYFSLLAHSDRCEGVTIRGAKYPLNDYTLTSQLPRAVSNEFGSGDATVHLKSGILLLTRCPKSLVPQVKPTPTLSAIKIHRPHPVWERSPSIPWEPPKTTGRKAAYRCTMPDWIAAMPSPAGRLTQSFGGPGPRRIFPMLSSLDTIWALAL